MVMLFFTLIAFYEVLIVTSTIDESKNRLGPNRCESDAECATGRVCLHAWCHNTPTAVRNEGIPKSMSRSVPTEVNSLNELNKKRGVVNPQTAQNNKHGVVNSQTDIHNKHGAHKCYSADECASGKTCSAAGWCVFWVVEKLQSAIMPKASPTNSVEETNIVSNTAVHVSKLPVLSDIPVAMQTRTRDMRGNFRNTWTRCGSIHDCASGKVCTKEGWCALVNEADQQQVDQLIRNKVATPDIFPTQNGLDSNPMYSRIADSVEVPNSVQFSSLRSKPSDTSSLPSPEPTPTPSSPTCSPSAAPTAPTFVPSPSPSRKPAPPWVMNVPPQFENVSIDRLGKLEGDVDEFYKSNFYTHNPFSGATDGEIRDAVEHFFWGVSNGVALELGASEGTDSSNSMTFFLEQRAQWRRILIEGDPMVHPQLKAGNPNAFTVGACICRKAAQVHYAKRHHVGGVVEFMAESFLEIFYPELLNSTSPRGDLSTADWSAKGLAYGFEVVDCLPLAKILRAANTPHVNLFILDVEGGEYDVLRSVDWRHTTFDVLCIETEEKLRPVGYFGRILELLDSKGYDLVARTVGRNAWFKRATFEPIPKPGLNTTSCWNGADRRSLHESC